MSWLKSFFQLEKEVAGWRFWLSWVVMTNIGFFASLYFGAQVARLVVDSGAKILGATVSAVIIGLLTGIGQGIVLRQNSSLPGA